MTTVHVVRVVEIPPNMPDIKSIASSKTIWLNTIAFVLFLVSLPQFGAVLPTVATPWIALLTAVLNGILRLFFTNAPLTQIAASRPQQ